MSPSAQLMRRSVMLSTLNTLPRPVAEINRRPQNHRPHIPRHIRPQPTVPPLAQDSFGWPWGSVEAAGYGEVV